MFENIINFFKNIGKKKKIKNKHKKVQKMQQKKDYI